MMCMNSPCIGTPADIAKIIDAGMEDILAPTSVLNLKTGLFHNIVAIKGIEGPDYDKTHALRCTMLLDNGLCALHEKGLKPMEGKYMIHDIPHSISVELRDLVLQTWRGIDQ